MIIDSNGWQRHSTFLFVREKSKLAVNFSPADVPGAAGVGYVERSSRKTLHEYVFAHPDIPSCLLDRALEATSTVAAAGGDPRCHI